MKFEIGDEVVFYDDLYGPIGIVTEAFTRPKHGQSGNTVEIQMYGILYNGAKTHHDETNLEPFIINHIEFGAVVDVMVTL